VLDLAANLKKGLSFIVLLFGGLVLVSLRLVLGSLFSFCTYHTGIVLGSVVLVIVVRRLHTHRRRAAGLPMARRG
jgi:hypothetical protein